jgi:hypothetical protein
MRPVSKAEIAIMVRLPLILTPALSHLLFSAKMKTVIQTSLVKERKNSAKKSKRMHLY